MRNALHQATITHNHPGSMINYFIVGLVKFFGKLLLSQGHPDSIGQTLT
ncbi:MAG: Uncharacterised protein [Prochlorococcus marinus str. MIT 9313]|nr:MAG: Uncharacterised protein [Prochlorococcus marinus str. MIT 9313]